MILYNNGILGMLYSNNDNTKNMNSFSNNEFNKTIDDPCAIAQRSNDNNKKLKFVTTNFRDLIEAKDNLNFFGMTIKDKLFVPSHQIDQSSELRSGSNGGIITNMNVSMSLGPLPFPTMPSRYQMYHGDTVVEDGMRNFTETNRQSCNPRDNEFYKKSFALFDDNAGIETPQADKSIEPSDFGPRGGISTRFLSRKKRM